MLNSCLFIYSYWLKALVCSCVTEINNQLFTALVTTVHSYVLINEATENIRYSQIILNTDANINDTKLLQYFAVFFLLDFTKKIPAAMIDSNLLFLTFYIRKFNWQTFPIKHRFLQCTDRLKSNNLFIFYLKWYYFVVLHLFKIPPDIK